MLTARSVLIVEDDDLVRLKLMELLTLTGLFQPQQALTLGEATRHLNSADTRFDLVILAVDLPDGDGPNFCARLRDDGHRMPVVIMAKSANDNEVARALNAGAADFIVVPFRAAELLARLRAALRSFDDSAHAVFTIGPWTFFPLDRRLTRRDGSRPVRLGDKEASLLKYLCRAGDRVIPPEVLLSEVWGYQAGVRTHTLQTHVYRLRQSLELEPKSPLFLVTVPGGYRLNTARDAPKCEPCRTCDAEKQQGADWCVASPGVRCHARVAA